VESAKTDMDAIKRNIAEIERLHGEVLTTTSKAASTKTENSLHQLMGKVKAVTNFQFQIQKIVENIGH
jgi:t-SNARE complex subunit (syntaxin)